MQTQRQSIFTKYAINLLASGAQFHSQPLKDHLQIPYIIDILGRKERHHILLHGASSEKIHIAILESIALHLNTAHVPKNLREANLIYFDVKQFYLGHEKAEHITHDFLAFCEEAAASNKLIIFAINDISLLETKEKDAHHALGKLGQLLQSKLLDNQWRVLVLNQSPQFHLSHLESFFSTIRLSDLTEHETVAILKAFQEEMENFHNVVIPEEAFHYSLSLATHYLPGKSILDKTLELLDSCAARASTLERQDQSAQPYKPILTTTLLAYVVSSWTQVPLSHLHHNKFKLAKFLPFMQQKIYGQDHAVNMIGSLLQSNCIKLRERSSSACNLLLTGPSGTGKKEFAFALAEYLFGNRESLLHVTLRQDQSISSLADIPVVIQSEKLQQIKLLEAIQSKPYAVVLFENLHDAPQHVIKLLVDIFRQGYAFDLAGQIYDFRHATIIITTSLGSEQIATLMQRHPETAAAQIMDLMQLVLNETASYTGQSPLSQQDLREHVLPTLQTRFPVEILQHSHIVPFFGLEQFGLEKIIKIKLQAFAHSLEINFGIELSLAPEVIKFLAHETIKQNENAKSIGKIFEQHVYSTIANEILIRIDDKSRPKRLALLLNDSGQILRCEFMTTNNETTVYKI